MSRVIEIGNDAYLAEVRRSPYTGKWVVCRVMGNLVESCELAAYRGEYRLMRDAIEAARESAEYALDMRKAVLGAAA